MAISLREKSLSSHQLARDLDLNQKTMVYDGSYVRKWQGGALLEGIIQADETYIGGNASQEKEALRLNPLNAGVQQGRNQQSSEVGKVVAQLAPNLTGRTILISKVFQLIQTITQEP